MSCNSRRKDTEKWSMNRKSFLMPEFTCKNINLSEIFPTPICKIRVSTHTTIRSCLVGMTLHSSDSRSRNSGQYCLVGMTLLSSDSLSRNRRKTDLLPIALSSSVWKSSLKLWIVDNFKWGFWELPWVPKRNLILLAKQNFYNLG